MGSMGNTPWKWGGGGSLQPEAVPDARERKRHAERGTFYMGGRGTQKGCKNCKEWAKGYPNRVLAERLYVERVHIRR